MQQPLAGLHPDLPNERPRSRRGEGFHFEAPQEISIFADRAILIGLIINELVTNAGKYAYPDRPGGPIWVTVAEIEKRVVALSIRDEGVGLPAGFDLARRKRLGTRLVSARSGLHPGPKTPS